MDIKSLSNAELKQLLETSSFDVELATAADKVRKEYYGTDVYLRGLIEFTNYCKNNCFYCGIRCGNTKLERYRLTEDEIYSCCETGYELGCRTFVMQGGEDPFYDDELLCRIISTIRHRHPDCAITLSIGEKTAESYQRYFDAGANRFLLRHETASEEHYAALHPPQMSLRNRKECLLALKQIGYQTGSGFMVGSPFQTTDNLIADLRFLQKLQPDMIGIGPFIVHHDTPFKDYPNGSLQLTLRLISVLRLMFPNVLLPATTALGTIDPRGRELGLRCGANVVMPNLSPIGVRKKYELYDNKICTGEEAAEGLSSLVRSIADSGYKIVTDIGNVKPLSRSTG
ncbi:MAG: [FeFe] hydrogenase H-cluster radical SAM maturase HydE [Planctomycetaceae bacterium]|nr:[FeFe] hydrogenase H-cluster radical SAM maturase HydE [Planctomycetaceae bacterium]